jgi:hypothetical protein
MVENLIIIFGEFMKKFLFFTIFLFLFYGLWAQQFSIPAGAELLESTEFKNNGIPYIIEQRYRLRSGEILYAYYDVEGQSSITIQRIEQMPILALGKNINISGMPGYREFNFGDDRRKLVQFLKLMKLGWQENYSFRGGGYRTPSLSDRIFNGIPSWRSEYILLLDLLDETWVLEHKQFSGRSLAGNDTTFFYRVKEFNDRQQ